jgi:excisionase family DNA binding protein
MRNAYEQERRALSIEEAARSCGLSRSTLYRLPKNGKLPTVKIGARRSLPAPAQKGVDCGDGDKPRPW